MAITTNSAAALTLGKRTGGGAISSNFQQEKKMANEKLPKFVKSTTDLAPVEVEFQDAGIHYGYAYTAGQTGIIRAGDVKELVKRRVVINPRPVTERAIGKGQTSKATL